MINIEEVYVPHLGWMKYPTNDEVARIIYEGHFESAEQAFFYRYLRSGSRFMDIGAHAGLYSCLAGAIIGEFGKIRCFEPDSSTRKILEANLSKHCCLPDTEVLPYGVWRKDGQLLFCQHEDGLSAHNCLIESDEVSSEEMSVEVRCLDNLFDEDQASTWDIIKMDAEGSEIDIITGGERFFSRHAASVCMVEFNELNLRRSGGDTFQLVEAFKSKGYDIYRYDVTQNKLVEASIDGPIYYENLFACVDVAAVNRRLGEATENSIRIGMDLWQRLQACRKMEELQELRTYKERAQLADDNKEWALETEERLSESRSQNQELTGINQELTGIISESHSQNQELTGINQELTGIISEARSQNQELTGINQELTGIISEARAMVGRISGEPRIQFIRRMAHERPGLYRVMRKLRLVPRRVVFRALDGLDSIL